ncbi:MAG: WecB/TagA/CpsF family glycosyltransferase [bacterium]|nr:WecB/TagA/CpsF family glycosyltransferase [bacterium]
MRIKILGVAIDTYSFHEAQKQARNFFRDGKQHIIVTPNPEFLLLARRDKEFHQILNQADLSLPDGVGLIFASYFLRQPIEERITGVSFVHVICDEAERASLSVFLLGSEETVVKKAAERLQKEYPRLRIAGIKSGGVIELRIKNDELGIMDRWRYEDTGVLDTIRQAKPDILFVALGQGKQEKWIADNLQSFPSIKIAMGVGGALDYIAGAASWAPAWVRIIGLEWLWRLIHNPWRWRRILNAVIMFPLVVIYEKIFGE